MSDSLTEFTYIENTKTKIITIAKELLGIELDVDEELMDDMVKQTFAFMADLEQLNDQEDAMYIIADLFVANIITTSLTFRKLQNVMEAYESLLKENNELKEKLGDVLD